MALRNTLLAMRTSCFASSTTAGGGESVLHTIACRGDRRDRTFGGGRGEWKDLVEYNYNDGEQKEEGEEKKEDRMHVLDMQRSKKEMKEKHMG
eukprot:7615639-Ditylum_brightwellii.AAC.1